MGETIKKAVHHNTWFWILTTVAIILIIASWLVPPMSVIDGSVLAAVGELAGFAAIGTVIKAMDMGVDARVRHNNTELTVGDINKRDRHHQHFEPIDTMEGEEDA